MFEEVEEKTGGSERKQNLH